MKDLAKFSLATLICFALPLSAAYGAIDPADKDTVAEVNGKKISLKEFERRYNENIKYFKFTPPTKLNVLNDIIKFELGVEEAIKLGLDKDPEIRERMNTVLYQSLIDKKLSERFGKIEVEEKDVKQYCKRYPELKTSHVYVPVKISPLKAELEAATKKINEAMAELKKGTSFEAVVAKFSDGYATNAGGDIGFQMKDKLDPVYYESSLKLKIGEYTTTPVRSQYGLHIIKLTAIRSCNDINVAEWSRMIYDEKRAKIFNDFLEGLRGKSKVSINYPLIKE
jgi:parvulin-like peptidyl-prolyl isomerase